MSSHPQHEAFTLSANLADCPEQAWTILRRAVHDRKSPMHTPTLITLASPLQPDGRVVVLRKALPETATLLAHTDARSDKARMLLASPNQTAPCAWLFYDASLRVQFRLQASLTLHVDGLLAATQWANSTLSSRRCYLAPHAPGSRQDEQDFNLPAHLRERVPTSKESEPGRANFAVLSSRLLAVDFLHLGAQGHARCAWNIDASGIVTNLRWLSP